MISGIDFNIDKFDTINHVWLSSPLRLEVGSEGLWFVEEVDFADLYFFRVARIFFQFEKLKMSILGLKLGFPFLSSFE